MFDIPTIGQLPLGIAIGVASVVAPWLLRPFLIVAVVLLAVQGGMLFAAGGTSALMTGMHWLASIAGSFAFVLAGLGIGRVGAEVLFGRC